MSKGIPQFKLKQDFYGPLACTYLLFSSETVISSPKMTYEVIFDHIGAVVFSLHLI